jgi:hypothetical protein
MGGFAPPFYHRLSGKFMHGDDLNDVSLKPDLRMAEILKLINKYRASVPSAEKQLFCSSTTLMPASAMLFISSLTLSSV